MSVHTSAESVDDDVAPAGSAAPKRDIRFSVVWLAVLLILGLLLGAGGTLWATRATTPGDNSVEAGFLRDMSTHHAQAVAMSMIAHAGSTDDQVISMAYDIALTQQAQIGYMQSWLRDWKLSQTGAEAPMAWMPDSAGAVVDGLMPGMATPAQMEKLRGARGKNLDVQYLTLMRAHHLGGIHMAQAAVDMSDNENVVWLAKTMVASQQGDVIAIDDMLKDLEATK